MTRHRAAENTHELPTQHAPAGSSSIGCNRVHDALQDALADAGLTVTVDRWPS